MEPIPNFNIMGVRYIIKETQISPNFNIGSSLTKTFDDTFKTYFANNFANVRKNILHLNLLKFTECIIRFSFKSVNIYCKWHLN